MNKALFPNPFRPGAGHMPPYLAGRENEKLEFSRLLNQDVIMENLILTGLRGIGKTVLLEEFKNIAIEKGWNWVGTDLSETASLTEDRLALRIITDLAVVTSSVIIGINEQKPPGFNTELVSEEQRLNFSVLQAIYNSTPGLVSDKLKSVLETSWHYLSHSGHKGIVFAYDEAQNLEDHGNKDEYPLSVMLEVFQSLQRKNIPFMLVLTGLPTLFPKLVDARTYAERMFRILFLKALDKESSRAAIRTPIENINCPLKLTDESVDMIVKHSGGYPYFIQFICREVYDLFIQRVNDGKKPSIPFDEITRKLDSDFFSGRWAHVTDRQRDLMTIIAHMTSCEDEFTVQEIFEASKNTSQPFGNSQINQMLQMLSEKGLVYKNRHGKYSLAVPLLAQFIRRQMANS